MSSDRMNEEIDMEAVLALFPKSLEPDMVIDFDKLPEPGSIADTLASIMTAVTDAGRRVAIVTGTDYGAIEMHILATMHHESSRGLVMELSPRGGELPGIADPFTLLRQSGGQIAEVLAKKSAVKQNGRSAAYLAHDPTKRHNRRTK